MGVYIKGFIPTDGLYVIKDGVIRKYKGKGGTVRPYELVEVKEPHGRLIDADALMLTIKDNKVKLTEWGRVPSAQPEIIRCKDCKYREENWRRVSVRWLPCMDVRTGNNWYCGSAERRTNE